ncbi:cytochrome c family protein [candidate division KSB1 bacterium]|nr:cytochrome c family protein [candidate division KSB1 bacterium]
MRKKIRPAFFAVAAVLLFSVFLAAQEKTPRFIGTEKCKMCHKSESRGNQYEKWSFSPHSKAFTVLATEHALKVAQDAGIKGKPQEAAGCPKCHVTAYGAPASAKAEFFSQDEGVGCEACHGPVRFLNL